MGCRSPSRWRCIGASRMRWRRRIRQRSRYCGTRSAILVRKLTADLERKSQLSCERLLRRMRRLSAFVIAIVVGFTGAAASQPAGDPAEAAFHAAITRYLDLHNRLKSEVPTFKVTTDPAEIVRVSDTLAAALQRARRNARRGDIFDVQVT